MGIVHIEYEIRSSIVLRRSLEFYHISILLSYLAMTQIYKYSMYEN